MPPEGTLLQLLHVFHLYQGQKLMPFRIDVDDVVIIVSVEYKLTHWMCRCVCEAGIFEISFFIDSFFPRSDFQILA